MPIHDDFTVPNHAIDPDKAEARQRNAASGGGEPPSASGQHPATGAMSMLDMWATEYQKANLAMTEVLFAKAGRGLDDVCRAQDPIECPRL